MRLDDIASTYEWIFIFLIAPTEKLNVSVFSPLSKCILWIPSIPTSNGCFVSRAILRELFAQKCVQLMKICYFERRVTIVKSQGRSYIVPFLSSKAGIQFLASLPRPVLRILWSALLCRQFQVPGSVFRQLAKRRILIKTATSREKGDFICCQRKQLGDIKNFCLRCRQKRLRIFVKRTSGWR